MVQINGRSGFRLSIPVAGGDGAPKRKFRDARDITQPAYDLA
jgi:hypothetical protein